MPAPAPVSDTTLRSFTVTTGSLTSSLQPVSSANNSSR